MFELKIAPEHKDIYTSLSGTEMSALDLRAIEAFEVEPNCIYMMRTGVSVWLRDHSLIGLVYVRSSIGRFGCRLANGTGVIDPDYQGELIVALHNYGGAARIFNRGDRIAQLIVVPQINVGKNVVLVHEFSDTTERGTGGFGSTGRA